MEAIARRKVWFITGCSTGFGHLLAQALITRGEHVVATARKTDALENLVAQAPDRVLAVKLDVTSKADRINAVDLAIRKFSRVDVLVNNAGYGILGAVEEIDEAPLRAIFETNVFGLVALTQLILPLMRSRRTGHVINMSSVAGFVSTPGLGVYNATKFAVEGLSEALAAEVGPLGIRVTLVEPGPFRTDFAGRSLARGRQIAEYEASVGATRRAIKQIDGTQPGDPRKAVHALIELVGMPDPPLRLPMGNTALDRILNKCESVTKEARRLENWTRSMDYDAKNK